MRTGKDVRIEIPEKVKTVLAGLRDAGHEAFIVGGCVRDSILGRPPKDWDITTDALPATVKEIFPRTVDTGIRHGTVTVMIEKEGFEVTTYRVDGDYLDGRHPENVTFTRSLLEDLKRRDFTINAMAYAEETGVVDEFDGLGDIERHMIRCVGDPMERFSEDALRIMRAMRFSAQLGYGIDADTLRAAARLAPNLDKVSAERIRVELEKILVSDHPDRIRTCWEEGVLQRFLPEFTPCITCSQNNPHHMDTVAEHTVKALLASQKDRLVRTALLLHDIGKPACRVQDADGTDHFPGHAEISAQMSQKILRRLKYDNATRIKVVKLVRFHSLKLGKTEEEIRRSIVLVGKDLFPALLEVKRGDARAQTRERCLEKMAEIDAWEEAFRRITERGDCLSLHELAINGGDLAACGIEPGKGMGEILNRCFDDVLTEPSHNTKEYLLARYAGRE